jgi:hypothetical protein
VSEFDYTATDTPDDVVRKVVADISGRRLRPLTNDERMEREAWRSEMAMRAELARIDQEQHRAEVEAAQRQEQADALAEANRRARIQARDKANREYQERQERRSRDYDLAILRNEAQQSALWRNAVQNSIAYQNRQTLISELESAINPPTLPPEPIVIQPDDDLGSPNIADGDRFNPGYWLNKPIFK